MIIVNSDICTGRTDNSSFIFTAGGLEFSVLNIDESFEQLVLYAGSHQSG